MNAPVSHGLPRDRAVSFTALARASDGIISYIASRFSRRCCEVNRMIIKYFVNLSVPEYLAAKFFKNRTGAVVMLSALLIATSAFPRTGSSGLRTASSQWLESTLLGTVATTVER